MYARTLNLTHYNQNQNQNKRLKIKIQFTSHLQINTKYLRVRAILAESNRTVASSVRAIDDVPQGSELIQYERRLDELYQQVSKV